MDIKPDRRQELRGILEEIHHYWDANFKRFDWAFHNKMREYESQIEPYSFSRNDGLLTLFKLAMNGYIDYLMNDSNTQPVDEKKPKFKERITEVWLEAKNPTIEVIFSGNK